MSAQSLLLRKPAHQRNTQDNQTINSAQQLVPQQKLWVGNMLQQPPVFALLLMVVNSVCDSLKLQPPVAEWPTVIVPAGVSIAATSATNEAR